MEFYNGILFRVVLLLTLRFSFSSSVTAAGGGSAKISAPLNCTDPMRLCISFLAVKSPMPAKGNETSTLAIIQSMFDVGHKEITVDPAASPGYFFVQKNCSCGAHRYYLTNTTFTLPRRRRGADVSSGGEEVYETVMKAYGGLAASIGRAGTAVVPLHLLCGCSSGLWNYLMTYVFQEGDSVESLSSRFGVSMDSIETANGLAGPDDAVVGNVYYIPLNSLPGKPYSIDKDYSPTPAPAPVPVLANLSVNLEPKPTRFPYGWVIGSMGVAFFFIGVALLVCISLKSLACCSKASKHQTKGTDLTNRHEFHILKSSSFCYTSRRYFCCKSGDVKSSNVDNGNHHISIPNGVIADAFDMEKPVVFTYQEILGATDTFSESNLLGHGTYGSVYYGLLRDQEVAIKRMTATKTKEFVVEMKVLCNVHHASLVELIGYAATSEELFLIYEYAQKGPLKNHLHDPQSKGLTSLSWISRVQIALDAARGLEYIHEHTRNHYVHRDIKSSNILLDNSLRAKISDFGLAKLILKTNDGEASATKVVGTFGYLAPEYLRDGLATPKSDVYALGVVIFELISGREAITKTERMLSTNFERRSLASIMLSSLKNSPNSTSISSFKGCIDPNLMDLYPHDCVYKMAMLAKQCVDDDPLLRPDMKQVVISLSHILLSSLEWESALAGNSQVFSGLVQGR